MIKREIKVNLKSLILWILTNVILFTVVYVTYLNMNTTEISNSINDLLNYFPEEIIKMFNLDIAGIESAFGWFKSEGYVFISLLTCLYSSRLGSTILLKEESEKTIEFLHSKPITRNQIVTPKIIASLINIILLFLAITLFNIFGMLISGNYDMKLLIILSVAPLLSAFPFFFLSMYISTYFNKTSTINGVSIGVVFISYFILIISTITENVKFFKYISLFTLSEGRRIIINNNIGINNIISSIVISSIFIFLIYYKYNKKELI